MRRLEIIKITAVLLILSQACPVRAGVVEAANYSSFWIWGGVRPQPVLSQAQSLYILQGQISEIRRRNTSKVIMIAQGMTVARLKRGKVWLVYRTNTLNWTPEMSRTIISRLKLWQLSENPIVGLQVDFDVKTKRLREYVSFLKQFRTQLPVNYKLSITGLLDWSCNGDIKTINQLKNIVDEVAIQTYQGKKTIPNCNTYLQKLKRLTLPFKIGLIQNGEWRAPAGLKQNPWFRGYIVFLQNQVRP